MIKLKTLLLKILDEKVFLKEFPVLGNSVSAYEKEPGWF
jgi:hypothetical protein